MRVFLGFTKKIKYIAPYSLGWGIKNWSQIWNRTRLWRHPNEVPTCNWWAIQLYQLSSIVSQEIKQGLILNCVSYGGYQWQVLSIHLLPGDIKSRWRGGGDSLQMVSPGVSIESKEHFVITQQSNVEASGMRERTATERTQEELEEKVQDFNKI